jgi:molybdopterin-guanine dinucleotide biosynthesis protein A
VPLSETDKPRRLVEVAAYVMAGGGSTRFGEDKARAILAGQPMLTRMCDLLSAATASVRIVAPLDRYEFATVPVIEDRWPGEGPLGGIITALLHSKQDVGARHAVPAAPTGSSASTVPAGPTVSSASTVPADPAASPVPAASSVPAAPGATDWNLILSCDMPFLTPEWLKYLCDFALASSAKAIVPQSQYGREPLCACWRASTATELQTAFEGGMRRVNDALKLLNAEVLDEAHWKRFDSAGRLFWNMNTPADYAEAQRILATEHS